MTKQTNTFSRPQSSPSTLTVWLLFTAIFAAVYFASLFTPPLMDDVDSTHAQAAQYFSEHSDWITAHINGIRYIEKPPLPYWTVAVLFHIFGQNVFSAHLPNTLAMLALTWLAWLWARRGWGPRAGFYAGLGVLTSVGPFLFTRFIIPEAQLSFFLLIALYFLLTGFEPGCGRRFYWMWIFLGLALMTKGLIAPVFFFGAAIPYMIVTGLWRQWRAIKPVVGPLLFLAVAAPWHILCGLANPDHGHAVGNHPTFGNVHGFFYFYFINEHYLRFFGQRYPHDYNKLPGIAYWLLHLVWIFPWSLFLPALVVIVWKNRRRWLEFARRDENQIVNSFNQFNPVFQHYFRARTIWLLGLFSAWTLLFFSISTNQEYYTFPVWPPLLILIAAVVAGIEEGRAFDDYDSLLSTKWLTGAQAAFAVIGVISAVVLGWGLWESRNLPFVDDVGTGASSSGRLHALHVSLVRPDFLRVCRSATAGNHRRHRPFHRACAGLDIASEEKTHCLHGQHGAYHDRFPHRSTYRICTIRSHAWLQADGRHNPRQGLARRLHHHLRRAVGRLVDHLLHAPLFRQAGDVRLSALRAARRGLAASVGLLLSRRTGYLSEHGKAV
jgi:4-amino-4-deoxy-L-arabinose transferase-like glycosyltransferase